METFFKRWFWTLQAFVAAMAALLLAAGVTGFLAARLVKHAVTVPSVPDDAPPSATDRALNRMDLPATVFGPEPTADAPVSLCADVSCPPGQTCDPETGGCVAEEPEEEEAPEAASDRCLESDIAINLVGTMISEDPRYSLAVLHNPTTSRTQFARVGTNLLAEADVLRVDRNRVTLLRNGREECLRYGDQATRAQRARGTDLSSGPSTAAPNRAAPAPRDTLAARPAPAAPAQTGTLDERMRTGVRRNQDGSYDIDRSLIQEVANNQSLMEQQAPNVSPHYVNGQPRGFQLAGIRSGSLFSRIGIRNGDVLTSVNGTNVDSPQRALELYEQMMTQSQVSVTVERRGRPQTLTYNVR